jgi:hypothetical protein
VVRGISTPEYSVLDVPLEAQEIHKMAVSVRVLQVSGGAAFRMDIGIGRSGIPVVTARDIYLPSDEPCLRS